MKNKVLLAIIAVLVLALGIETVCFISYKHDYDKRVAELENKKEDTQQEELDDSGYQEQPEDPNLGVEIDKNSPKGQMISTLLTTQLRNTYGVDIRVDHVIVRNGSKRISELYPTASSNAVFAEVIYAINDIQNEALLNDGGHIDGEWVIGKKIYAYIELVENEYKIISSDQIW